MKPLDVAIAVLLVLAFVRGRALIASVDTRSMWLDPTDNVWKVLT